MSFNTINRRMVQSVLVTIGLFGHALGGNMEEPESIIDFQRADALEWRVINDGVMGGLSRSGIERTDHDTGVFSGHLSLENNGGFASVRAQVGSLDLSAFSGLQLKVKGDGRTYQLRLRTDDRFDGVAYRAFFETTADKWVTVMIPFEDFMPTYRGRILDDHPALDTTDISQVGFMLADRRTGKFSLEIDWVQAWKTEGDN
jgi:monofunctional biosynthetic peptidoglycan transglycosylase